MSSRGAPLKPLDDPTPLNGPRIDVAVRIGWVLRMARLTTGPVAVPRLEDMASRLTSAGLHISSTTLHRLETGGGRDGGVVDAYEATLGLPGGSLRAAVDILCRTFPYAPADRNPGGEVTSVEEMSKLVDPLLDGGGDGGQWLGWARAISRPGMLGLPERVAHELVRRLVSEMARAVGSAYLTRYEALSLLRCSAFGTVVLRVAREEIADPHVQVLNDLMSAVGESATPDAVAWAVSLLTEPREHVAVGAVLALENMAETGGDPAFWRELVDPVVAAYNDLAPGTAHWRWLSHVIRLFPRAERLRAERLLDHPLYPRATIKAWSRTRLNTHWSTCEGLAHRLTQQLDLPDQPLLARLLFEVAMGPQESRAVTSYMLLSALPALRAPVGEVLAEVAVTHPDPVVRERSARRLAGMRSQDLPGRARAWLDDPGLQAPALLLAGGAGMRLDGRTLRGLVARRPELRREALYCAGMTGHPVLTELAGDASLPPDARGGAGWWLAHGSRVTDEVTDRGA